MIYKRSLKAIISSLKSKMLSLFFTRCFVDWNICIQLMLYIGISNLLMSLLMDRDLWLKYVILGWLELFKNWLMKRIKKVIRRKIKLRKIRWSFWMIMLSRNKLRNNLKNHLQKQEKPGRKVSPDKIPRQQLQKKASRASQWSPRSREDKIWTILSSSWPWEWLPGGIVLLKSFFLKKGTANLSMYGQ